MRVRRSSAGCGGPPEWYVDVDGRCVAILHDEEYANDAADEVSRIVRERDEARVEVANLREALSDPSKTAAGCALIRGALDLSAENKRLREELERIVAQDFTPSVVRKIAREALSITNGRGDKVDSD